MNEHKTLVERLTRFNDFFYMNVCSRCARSRMRDRGLAENYNAHHQSQFYEVLRGTKQVTPNMIDKWFADIDHGFVHSYFVAFQAFNLKYDMIPESSFQTLLEHHNEPTEDEQLLASCLLHDVVKTAQNEEKDHDVKLKLYFQKLHRSAYTHYTAPMDDHPLVRGDRLELLRYSDAHLWVDYSRLDPIDEVQKYFYQSFRPGIVELIKRQNEVFVRHGIEKLEGYDKNCPSYPQEEGSWIFEGDGFYWAIDTGISPVGKCITAHKKYYDRYLEPLGILPMSTLKSYRPTFEPAGSMPGCTGKDHLVVKTEIPVMLNDWFFIYDVRRNNVENFEWLYKNAKLFVPYHLLKEILEVQDLLKTNWLLLSL